MSATETRSGDHEVDASVEPTPPGVVSRPVGVLLDELGGALDAAFATRRSRGLGLRSVLVAAAVLVAASTAVGAFALSRPRVAAAPGALAKVTGLIASGTAGGVHWELAARACGEQAGAYALVLVTASGSGQTACVRGVSRPPSTVYDQVANVALVFGVAPSGTSIVVVADSGGGQAATTALTRGPKWRVAGLPRGAAFFVSKMALARTATAITVYGASARLLEACNERTCVAP